VFLYPHFPRETSSKSQLIPGKGGAPGAVFSSCYRARIRGRRRTWPVGPVSQSKRMRASAGERHREAAGEAHHASAAHRWRRNPAARVWCGNGPAQKKF
jgi:hypothetical protein